MVQPRTSHAADFCDTPLPPHSVLDILLPVSKMQSVSRPASTSTRPTASPNPRPTQHQVNTKTQVFDTTHGRLLCIADIRGRVTTLNDLAREANASAIIHTGDFGFFGAYMRVCASRMCLNSPQRRRVLTESMTEPFATSQCTRP